MIELVVLALQVGGVDARRAFAGFEPTGIDDNAQLDQRDARRPFTLPADFEPNQHRKPFTAPPLITGRPVIENEIPVERPVIQETTLTTSVLSQR
ncbi:hypothetical protein M409DRAFT_23284 [Zasmidium cellare ATCC 36951]|uniref:Uncharacterized protein n=1 Tax=Zasmidium cellare ATCC 36951 TaxID=1080233 RepID=A0A6A6CJ77_ZASCE|nr:uncharacterized protein M409DRAFT_23284 [Zasmidium cellare ATCC 36951]KAF2166653.1 hypothetical protein M409DRAFT_23284 [Zasmidium cellare ATCC 36951]